MLACHTRDATSSGPTPAAVSWLCCVSAHPIARSEASHTTWVHNLGWLPPRLALNRGYNVLGQGYCISNRKCIHHSPLSSQLSQMMLRHNLLPGWTGEMHGRRWRLLWNFVTWVTNAFWRGWTRPNRFQPRKVSRRNYWKGWSALIPTNKGNDWCHWWSYHAHWQADHEVLIHVTCSRRIQ